MRAAWRVVVPILVLASWASLVAAACGDDDASTTPPTTTPAPVPTTVAMTSSVVPARPAPAGRMIVARGLLLGWWDGSTWRRVPEAVADGAALPLQAGARYTFVSVDGQRVDAALGSGTSECIEPDVPVFVEVPEEVRDLLGVASDVEPWPRPVETVAAAEAHRDAVRSWLRDEGLQDPEVVVQRVVQVDVDGDGTPEELIEASRITEPSLLDEPVGDYAVVLLRRPADGASELVRGDVVSQAEAEAESFPGFLETAELLAVADVDGDTRLEVAVATAYYEGRGVALFTWSLQGGLTEVLAAGCGA